MSTVIQKNLHDKASASRKGPDVVRRKAPRKKRRSGIVVASASWLALLVIAIVLQPVLPLPSPTAINYSAIALPPFQSAEHLLGTDAIGRDLLARVITGGYVSLAVGLGSVAIATLLGSIIGLLSGFFGGIGDKISGAVTDVLLAFPPLIAMMALSFFMGASLPTLIIALGLVFTSPVARVARSATLIFVHREFVIAARGMGFGAFRILWREVVPNVVVPVISYSIVLIAMAIVAEAGLSFLGLGVPPPQSSWGSMMSEGRTVLTTTPHAVLVPATAMFLTLLSLNFVAEYLTKRFDIKEAAL